MSSSASPVYDVDSISVQDLESGYVSGSGSEASIPEVYFSKPHLHFLNRQLQNLEPPGQLLPPCHFTRASLTQRFCRNLTMVHHYTTFTVSNNRFRPHRLSYTGHAVKNEDPKAPNGGPHLF